MSTVGHCGLISELCQRDGQLDHGRSGPARGTVEYGLGGGLLRTSF